MGVAIVTIRVMPESPEIDLKEIEKQAFKLIDDFAGKGDRKSEIVPVAFGLKALNLMFSVNESKGSPDPVAEKIAELDGVQSAEVTDVRRAIG
jgi:elongation factor 1-beta